MKVFVVMQFDAEPYESFMDGIHKVFSSKESAEKYIQDFGKGPHMVDGYCGYYLSDRVTVWKVYD